MPNYRSARKNPVAHKSPRLHRKRARTASYFYIISTWPPRYYVPPPSLSLPLFCVPDRYFLPKPAVFLETTADLFPETHALPCSLFNRRCIMFLGGEPQYTYIRSVAPSPTPVSPPPSPFPRYTPLCAGVYPIRAILILIKSAERIVWA